MNTSQEVGLFSVLGSLSKFFSKCVSSKRKLCFEIRFEQKTGDFFTAESEPAQSDLPIEFKKIRLPGYISVFSHITLTLQLAIQKKTDFHMKFILDTDAGEYIEIINQESCTPYQISFRGEGLSSKQ